MHQLPPTLVAAIQHEALRVVAHYAPSRSELAALRRLVMARLCVLTPAEREFLADLLPALQRLRPGKWATCREVLALATVVPGPDGEALRRACKPYLQNTDGPGDAHSLGKRMSRCTAVPIDGRYLERLEGEHRRDSAVYCVVGLPG